MSKKDLVPANPPNVAGRLMVYTQSLPKINPKDPEQLAQRTADYFTFCAENGVIPLVESYCTAISTPMRTVEHWRKTRSKALPPEALEVLDAAHEQILSGVAMSAASGALNPVWSMFYLKVHGRYDDQPSKDAPVVMPDEHEQTAADIALKYQDMPDD